jgi:hypothetical protein
MNVPGRLADRIARLEELARMLEPDDLAAIGKSVMATEGTSAWPPSERYWFSRTAGVRFDEFENHATRVLWTRLLVALALAPPEGDAATARNTRPGLIRRLREWSSRNRIEGTATTILERRLGPDVWASVTGVWNAECAALHSERFDADLRTSLEAPWVGALGQPPRERIGLGDSARQ